MAGSYLSLCVLVSLSLWENHSPMVTSVKNGQRIYYYMGLISTGTHQL